MENRKKSFLERLTSKDKSLENKEIAETKTIDPPLIKEQSAPKEKPSSEYEGQLTIDVYQTLNDIIIKSTIAGVNPENIDITINNDMITIKGERKNDQKVKEEDYFYQECYWGKFSRSIILPMDVEASKAEAELKNGILTLTLPKANKAKTRKITVKTAD